MHSSFTFTTEYTSWTHNCSLLLTSLDSTDAPLSSVFLTRILLLVALLLLYRNSIFLFKLHLKGLHFTFSALQFINDISQH